MNVNSVSFDPSRSHFEPYGLTCVNWQPSLMPRPDHHNEVKVNLLRSGYVTYLLGGRKVTLEAGRISLFWGAIPHQIIDFKVESPYLVATIPLHNFIQWRLPERFVQLVVQGQLLADSAANRQVEADFELFERWVSDLEGAQTEKQSVVLLELQARLMRMALSFPIDSVVDSFARVSNTGLSKVEQMAGFIAQNYTQKITVQDVADLVGLNQNYAMNLFQKSFGTTLISYLTQLRLSHAQRLLTTSDTPITDIAMQSGFQSISRFNDVCSNAFGCSPRQYRKLHK